MTKKEITTLKEQLATPKNIVVVSHRNPDGDAMGSSLAMAEYLEAQSHSVQVIMPNDFPQFLRWMPHSDRVLLYERETNRCDEGIAAADLVFVLDFNELSRVGDAMARSLEKARATFVMIDHHQSPGNFATYTYSDATICATAQMVFHFMEMMGDTDSLTPTMATNLYTGIMTDTGSFRFPSTTAVTHQVAAHLIDQGIDHAKIHQAVFDNNSPNRMQLLGTALQNLKILPQYKTAYITLSQEELDRHNFKKGDTEGFVNYALSVEGVVFAVIFIENKQEGIIKMSLRSQGNFSVNEYARKHFNGGGHTNAAGGRSEKGMEETISYFIRTLPDCNKSLQEAFEA